MTFLSAPPWIQVLIGAEALALGVLTARLGWRGLVWGLAAALLSWFVVGLGASFLVGRLEGGRAAELSGLIPGAILATGRLCAAAAPAAGLAIASGALWRWRRNPKRG